MIFPPDDDTKKAACKTTIWGKSSVVAIDMPREMKNVTNGYQINFLFNTLLRPKDLEGKSIQRTASEKSGNHGKSLISSVF